VIPRYTPQTSIRKQRTQPQRCYHAGQNLGAILRQRLSRNGHCQAGSNVALNWVTRRIKVLKESARWDMD